MPHIKIGRRTITAIQLVSTPTIFYDTDLTGFGLKVHPSVVNDRLCVHGIGGLRVIDASIMPSIVSGTPMLR